MLLQITPVISPSASVVLFSFSTLATLNTPTSDLCFAFLFFQSYISTINTGIIITIKRSGCSNFTEIDKSRVCEFPAARNCFPRVRVRVIFLYLLFTRRFNILFLFLTESAGSTITHRTQQHFQDV